MIRMRTVATTVVAGLATVTFAVAPAHAAPVTHGLRVTVPNSTPEPEPGLEARLDKACARVPIAVERTNTVLARLNGDASTKGSIAWLQAQIDEARAAGKDKRVTFLENRLTVRIAKLEFLQVRVESLDKAQAFCDRDLAG